MIKERRGEEKRRRDNKKDAMVFGDNVRARKAARALPRTPTQKGRERKRDRKTRQATRTTHPPHHRHSTTHNIMRQDKTRTVITTRWYADSILHTPHALLPNTHHHHYSPITQPCHKDTAPNQQCCDREHRRWKRGEEERRIKEGKQCKTGKTMQEEREQCEEDGDNTRQGDNTQPAPPAIQQGHRVNDKGTPTRRRPTDIQRGVSNTAALPHHATHHPLCHPTIHDGPTHHHDEGGTDRGYPTTRTAQTYTHHPHTAAPGKEHCVT